MTNVFVWYFLFSVANFGHEWVRGGVFINSNSILWQGGLTMGIFVGYYLGKIS